MESRTALSAKYAIKRGSTANDDHRVLVVTHYIRDLKKLVALAEENKLNFGVEQASNESHGENLVFASLLSIKDRTEKFSSKNSFNELVFYGIANTETPICIYLSKYFSNREEEATRERALAAKKAAEAKAAKETSEKRTASVPSETVQVAPKPAQRMITPFQARTIRQCDAVMKRRGLTESTLMELTYADAYVIVGECTAAGVHVSAKKATPKQIRIMKQMGLSGIEYLSVTEAGNVIEQIVKNKKLFKGLAYKPTEKQVSLLKKFGRTDLTGWSKTDCTDVIRMLAGNGWKNTPEIKAYTPIAVKMRMARIPAVLPFI